MIKRKRRKTMKEFHADKRTDEQRKNDAAQKVRKGSAQDTHYVTTGPATGKEDERSRDTEE